MVYGILQIRNLGGATVDMDTTQIAGVIYKHGDDDYSIWFPELSAEENKEVNALLEKFANSGCSTRGRKQDIVDEVSDSLK